MTVEQLNVIITAQNTEFKRRLDEVNGRLDDMSDTAQKSADKTYSIFQGLGNKIAALGIGKFIADSIMSGGELEQNLGGSEAVFKAYAESIQNSAASAYKDMGLSESRYLATANKMGALFKGSGMDIERSAQMTQIAMQRAADVASIMGIDTASAMEAVTGAAKGNFTMMDNLGVAINDTTLQIYAQEKGLGKLETTQDKVNAAMQMFLEKTEYAAGNYARENETFSGSLSTLQAEFENLTAEIGTQLLPAATSVLSVMSTGFQIVAPIITGVAKAVNVLAQGLFILTGFQKGNEQTASTIKDTTVAFDSEKSSADEAADGIDNLADSMGGLEKATKGSLAAVDRLNILNSASVGASAKAASNYDVSSFLDDIQNKVGNNKINLADNVEFDIKDVLNSAKENMDLFWTALTGSGDEQYEALKILNERIRNIFGDEWVNHWNKVGETIYDAFANPDISARESALKTIHDWLSDIDGVFAGFFGDFGEGWSEFWQGVGSSVYELIYGETASRTGAGGKSRSGENGENGGGRNRFVDYSYSSSSVSNVSETPSGFTESYRSGGGGWHSREPIRSNDMVVNNNNITVMLDGEEISAYVAERQKTEEVRSNGY